MENEDKNLSIPSLWFGVSMRPQSLRRVQLILGLNTSDQVGFLLLTADLLTLDYPEGILLAVSAVRVVQEVFKVRFK